MGKLRFKGYKTVALILTVTMAFTLLCGFGNAPGIGNVVYDPSYTIAPGVNYTLQKAVHSTNGPEQAYEIEANLSEGSVMPYVYTGGVAAGYKLSTMVSNLTADGYRVIAGVNGDFFNTSDYTNLGINIHDGYIYSSGSNETKALAFKKDGTAFVGDYSFDFPMEIKHTSDGSITNLNVVHINQTMAAGTSIHFYNSRYGQTTKTKISCVEVVFQAEGTCDPSMSGAVTGTVVSVSPKTGTKATAIGAGQFVLSTSASSDVAWQLAELVPGDTATITVTNKAAAYPWDQVTEAIGAHDIIAQNGSLVTSGTWLSPRTCVGVKPDGNIIIYAVDGRDADLSTGLSLSEVGEYLLDRGCTDVINFDGGGSTTVAVRTPGDTTAKVVNNPSDGSERKVANGLLLVARVSASSGQTSNIAIVPNQAYALTNATVPLSVKTMDESYYPSAMPQGTVSYTADKAGASVSADGKVKVSPEPVNVTVTANLNGISSSALIRVINTAEFTLNTTSVKVKAGETKDINVKSVSYMYNTIYYDDTCFTWSCDSKIGTIDAAGVFTAADTKSAQGNIYCKLGDTTKTIPVTVGSDALFSDISGNWAKEYIETLANAGIISGLGDGTFGPGQNVTRAQFVKLLAGAVGVTDFSDIPDAGFTDVPSSSWYAPYVNWACDAGIVSGMGDGTFAPNSYITREQMAVMIDKLGSYALVIFEPVSEYISFYDQASISSWAVESVQDVVCGGIMNGKPAVITEAGVEKTVTVFQPQGNATRAEASKVICITRNLLSE